MSYQTRLVNRLRACPRADEIGPHLADRKVVVQPRWRVRAGLLIAAAVAAGCDTAGERTVAIARRTMDERILTGTALSALTASGQFREQPRVSTSATPAPIYAARGAEEAAMAYWHAFGAGYSEMLAFQRGAPIDVARLTACGNSRLAESTWPDPSLEEASAVRAYLGPVWIVPLCAGAEPQVVMSVAAFIGSMGSIPTLLSSPATTSAGFWVTALPVGGSLVLSAEEAAILAALRSGRRIRSVPRLVRGDPPLAGTNFMWQVELERPISVRFQSSGATAQLSTLYVGSVSHERWTPDLQAARAVPGEDSVLVVDEVRAGGSRSQKSVRRRPELHYSALERIAVQPGGAP